MSERLRTALAAARAAAERILDGATRLNELAITTKGPSDWATEIDHAAERAITAIIWAAYPGDAVLGEEGGLQAGPAAASGVRWIVDPLDGTYNFAHGLPFVAVSIAVEVDGVLTDGVVMNPFRNEVFHASRGEGAFLNGTRLCVSRRTDLADALIGTVLPAGRAANFEAVLPDFLAVTRAAGSVRRLGAAALDMAYVAAGRMDGFFVLTLKPWDYAAGAVLITEAGGIVLDRSGGNEWMQRQEIVCGNATIARAIVEALRAR